MANTSTAGTGGSAKPTKTEQNLFEEDDEFEEFPAEGKGKARATFERRKLCTVWSHLFPPQNGMYMVRMWVTASSGRTTGMMTV